ncbi:HD-GYP domain-containing protein [Marinomonas epiphytica]
MTYIACNEFLALEAELKSDMLESLVDAQQEVEAVIVHIKHNGFSKEILDQLFRTLHSIKGNCAVCFLDPFVDVLHCMEEIIDAIRQDHISYDDCYVELSSLVLEQLGFVLQQVRHEQAIDSSVLSQIKQGLDHVFKQDQESVRVGYAQHLLGYLKGDSLQAVKVQEPSLDKDSDVRNPSLDSFIALSYKLNPLLGYTPKRNEKLLQLSLLINTYCDEKASSSQLAAAVYMHNMGHAVVLKKQVGSQSYPVHLYPKLGADILARYPGFQEAADIVLCHQERFDGTGFPLGKKGESIPQGSFIISMSLIFIDMVCGKQGKEYSRSALHAVKAINLERGKAFPPYLIDRFNRAIKQLLVHKAGDELSNA